MTAQIRGKRTATLLAVLMMAAAGLHAGAERDIKKGFEDFKHALGWDTINLHSVEQDSAGRPTLERENNASNLVERKTSYQPNGNKDRQSVTVYSKSSKKRLFTEDKAWNDKGDLDSDRMQDDVFHKDGRQMRGLIIDKTFKDGRLVTELRKHYSAATDAWSLPLKQNIAYYADGDMRERITENPAGDERIRESWSEKEGVLGRKETTTRWNEPKSVWE
jgi:hypothetical protein